MQSLEEAKEFLKDNWTKGCECPACGQHVQLYDYKLFDSNAVALIELFKLTRYNSDDIYFHARQFAYGDKGIGRAMHYADMRFWGLIAPKAHSDDPTKKSSGYWCITEKGKKFVLCQLSVPSRILVFNNKFKGFSDKSEPITIRNALNNNFNYQELMGNYLNYNPQVSLI